MPYSITLYLQKCVIRQFIKYSAAIMTYALVFNKLYPPLRISSKFCLYTYLYCLLLTCCLSVAGHAIFSYCSIKARDYFSLPLTNTVYCFNNALLLYLQLNTRNYYIKSSVTICIVTLANIFQLTITLNHLVK